MIKVWFTDHWNGWDNYDNWITKGVLKGIPHVVSPNDPDIIFYTVFGQSHKNYTCKKVFWTGESVRPNFIDCDLAFTFDYDENPKNLRVPLYAIHYWNARNMWNIGTVLDVPKKDAVHTEFCNFIYGNSGTGVNGWGNHQVGVSKRMSLFEKLNSYKKVDSCGTVLNNVGFRVNGDGEKINFIKKYKFTFAIENTSFPGYVTEKIMDPMLANSIPVYWGSPRISEEFNEKSFVNCHNFKTEDEIVEYIIYLDTNDDKYNKMYSEAFVHENEYFNFERMTNAIKSLLS